MDNFVLLTAKELSNKTGIDQIITSALLRYLLETKKITLDHQRPNITDKGKPSNVFKVPKTITLTFE